MTEKKLKEPVNMTCLTCVTEMKASTANFYEHNNNPLIGSKYYPMCKKCIAEYLGEENTDEYVGKFQVLLQQLNRPWNQDLWKKFKGNRGKYMRQVSTFDGDKTFQDSDQTATSNISNERSNDFSEKWRGKYSNEDIDFLNGYLDGLMNDFKIINTSHLDYAKKISKASLHMDKCFEEMQNGVSGADKKYETSKKIFDDLSKSANFAESSRSKDNASGSLSKIVDTVENGTYVYKHVPFEQDLYDRLLENQKHVEKSL